MEIPHSFNSVICSHCGNVIRVPIYCGNRFCPECGKNRRMKIERKLRQFVLNRRLRSADTFKHLTLTVASSEDLTPMVKHLIASFRRLRQRSVWKHNVRGGAFVVELTKSEQGWHAHIHAIIESAYIPWAKLRFQWEAVSGGSGCFIQRIPAYAIVKYLTKYITKSDLPHALQIVASQALRGTRLFNPFGEWHKPIAEIKVPVAVCSTCGRNAWAFGPMFNFLRREFGKKFAVQHSIRAGTPFFDVYRLSDKAIEKSLIGSYPIYSLVKFSDQ